MRKSLADVERDCEFWRMRYFRVVPAARPMCANRYHASRDAANRCRASLNRQPIPLDRRIHV